MTENYVGKEQGTRMHVGIVILKTRNSWKGILQFHHDLIRLAACADIWIQNKELGGGTAGTADPNWPRGYSTPYGVMLNNKTGGSWPGNGGPLLRSGLKSWILDPIQAFVVCFL